MPPRPPRPGPPGRPPGRRSRHRGVRRRDRRSRHRHHRDGLRRPVLRGRRRGHRSDCRCVHRGHHRVRPGRPGGRRADRTGRTAWASSRGSDAACRDVRARLRHGLPGDAGCVPAACPDATRTGCCRAGRHRGAGQVADFLRWGHLPLAGDFRRLRRPAARQLREHQPVLRARRRRPRVPVRRRVPPRPPRQPREPLASRRPRARHPPPRGPRQARPWRQPSWRCRILRRPPRGPSWQPSSRPACAGLRRAPR